MSHLVQTKLIHRPLVLIFMGVSGSGKTTIATLFAKKTGAICYEGDSFHPPENIKKMRNAIPLTDKDREKWLQTLREVVARSLEQREFVVTTCCALKSAYRELLRAVMRVSSLCISPGRSPSLKKD